MLSLNKLNSIAMNDRMRCFTNNRRWWWHTPQDIWHLASATRPASMPDKPACYVLSLDGAVIYVGQTTNLRARFYSHRIKCISTNRHLTRWGEICGELMLRVRFAQRYGDWAMREQRLIERLAPKFNMRLC